jgi:hypothetical protein
MTGNPTFSLAYECDIELFEVLMMEFNVGFISKRMDIRLAMMRGGCVWMQTRVDTLFVGIMPDPPIGRHARRRRLINQ